ncbi:MAG: BamA/TamA family outer membrane protein, partial [Ferruginibacter sp.]
RRGLLKNGDPYVLSTITAERERLDLFIKTKGYYFFNPDYLMAYADSTPGNRKVNIILNIKRITPMEARYPYTINTITIFPDYSLTSNELDTSKKDAVLYDGLIIKDPDKKFKPALFKQTITYRPGRLYSSRTQNTTLNRLINLGPFKFVKNRFEPISDSSSTAVKDSGNFNILIDTASLTPKKDTADILHRLDVYYYLTPAKKKSLQAEIDGFTKENNYIGSQVSVNWKNRNAFRGGEQLAVKLYGGFQTNSADSAKNNSFRVGTEVSLRMPRYAIPFFHIKENFFYPPNTNIVFGYEWFRQDLYYTKNLFRLQYDFTWKRNLQTEITFAPVALSYLKVTAVTDSFYKQTIAQPSLLTTIFSEFTIGSFLSYTYNSGYKSRKNKWYLMGSVDWAGNIEGAITGAKKYREKTIAGVPFAQYVKLDVDIHLTRKLKDNFDWANRVQIGAGLPYGNSRLLPYSKLYTIGGSSSIRGFRSRSLGPGTYKPTGEDQKYFQLIGGDFKLLANTELRIPFTKQLGGAVFIDAGNIWTKDTLLFGEPGKLSKNFYQELAVAAGIGIRFDATILLIRADLGVPLRKPYLPQGQRWVSNFDFGSGAWRRENLILNIAIGYPF